jgi:hypothetical protein
MGWLGYVGWAAGNSIVVSQGIVDSRPNRNHQVRDIHSVTLNCAGLGEGMVRLAHQVFSVELVDELVEKDTSGSLSSHEVFQVILSSLEDADSG